MMEQSKKIDFKQIFRSHFTVPRMAYMAIFTALAFVVTFLEFPIFPAVPFLKLDFANLFFILEGFMLGPVEAVVSIALKELLCLTKSSTAGVGELANFIMSTSYILIPAVGYRYKKGIKWVVVFLVAGCAMQIAVGLLCNRFINFPLYGGIFHFDGVAMFQEVWYYILFFNAIKSVVIGTVSFFVYKPLSKTLKRAEEKFKHS